MIKKSFLLLFFLVGLAVVNLGCGSGEETTAAVTKAQLLVRGDAICWEALKVQEAAFQDALKEGIEEEVTKFDPDRQKALIGQMTGSVHKMVDELSDLGAPSGEKAKVDRILAAYESGASQAEEKPQVLLSGEAFKNADAAARDYGFKKCSLM